MWIKLTNCTTTTGGSKTPLRWRKNQNITLNISDDVISLIKPNMEFISRGRVYYTSNETKIIIKNYV